MKYNCPLYDKAASFLGIVVSQKHVDRGISILIFRGTDADEKEPRPSWSLDYNVAEKFNHGKMMKANISKERIMAYFDTDEREILVWLNQDEVEII